MNELSRQDTQEYLRVVSKLEASVYTQEKFLSSLRQKLNEQKKKTKEAENVEIPVATEWHGSAIARFFYGFFTTERLFFKYATALAGFLAGIATVIAFTIFSCWLIGMLISGIVPKSFNIPLSATTGWFSGIKNFDRLFSCGVIVWLLDHFIPGIIMLIRTPIINRRAKEYYQYEYTQEIQARKEKDENIKKNKEREKELYSWIASAETSLQNTKNELANVYSYDIIYPKYRNFIAMCTIYEYYDSFRCDTLTGHEGAYNIYENELRQNIIIGMLDQINTRLDVIERHQQILARELQETNSRLAVLDRKVEQVHSIAETANYNAEIAASNTKYLACIETMRFIHEYTDH